MPMHGDDAVSQGGGIGDGDRREVQCVLVSDRPGRRHSRTEGGGGQSFLLPIRIGWGGTWPRATWGALDLSKRVRVGRSSDATLLCLIITSLQYVTATLDPLTWLACSGCWP
jgi:hypothetical protein